MTKIEEQKAHIIRKAAVISNLSMEIRNKGLAQAFYDFHGHTNSLDARVLPIDTRWDKELRIPPPLAKLDIAVYFYDWMNSDEVIEDYQRKQREMDIYISYLQLILAKGKAILLQGTTEVSA